MILQTLQPPMAKWEAKWETARSILGDIIWGEGGWEPLAITAVLISFFIIAIAYMIGRGFESEELKRWARGEFYNALASAVLVIGLIVLANILMVHVGYMVCALTRQECLTDGDALSRGNPFNVARAFVDESIICMKNFYNVIFKANMLAEAVEKTNLNPAEIVPKYYWAFTPFVEFFRWSASRITFLFIVNYFQIHLLNFAEATMFTIFLPLGIILRIIPYVRGAGAFLTSLAIGMFLVYPLVFVLVMAMLNPIYASDCELEPTEIENYCATDPAGIGSLIYEAEEKKGLLEIQKSKIFQNMKYIWNLSLFCQPMILMIVFVFIRSLSQFMGAEIGEIGQGLIRII